MGAEIPPHRAELAGREQDPPLSQQRREEPHDVLIPHSDHQLREIPLGDGEAQRLGANSRDSPSHIFPFTLRSPYVLRNRRQAGRIRVHRTRKLVGAWGEDSTSLHW